MFTCTNNTLHLSHFCAEAHLVIHFHSYNEKGILHCRMEIRVTLSMKWQSILLSCYFHDFARKVTWYFAAIVVIIIFISLQGNVTTTELWAISKLSVDDVDVVKGNHTAGTVTLEKMKYNTTFTALSKTLKS